MARKSKMTEKERAHRWAQIEEHYRRKQRLWTMEVLPSMPEAQWKEYTKWVATFGSGKKGRKFRRNLNVMFRELPARLPRR